MSTIPRLLSVALLLAGCAGPWARPGASQADLSRDSAECDYDAAKATASAASAVDAGWNAGQLHTQCMKLRGWTR